MLLLDANILVRAVLGSTVRLLLRKYAGQIEFFAPDVAFQMPVRSCLKFLPLVKSRPPRRWKRSNFSST